MFDIALIFFDLKAFYNGLKALSTCVYTSILYIQWTIPTLLYQTRRKNLLVQKGCDNVKTMESCLIWIHIALVTFSVDDIKYLTLCVLCNYSCFYHFQNKLFLKTIRVSNILDQDQDRLSVGPDWVQTVCFRLSADDKSRR